MPKKSATIKPNKETRRPRGISPTIEIPPDGDSYVPVAVDSLEARVGYGSLLRQLQESYIVRVAFFRSKEGGALSPDEARAHAFQSCEDEEEAKRLYDELRSNPVDQIRFIDLASMWRISSGFSESLWEMIKTEARDEFESGHLASKALSPTQFLRTAWGVASYLGLRESFVEEWQPQGGIQVSLIDMLAQSFFCVQHWVKQSVLRSQTPLRKSNAGYIQWQEQFNPDAVDDGYTYGHWDLPYVSEQAAVEHATRMADRWHRIYMRTLRGMRDLRRYSVTIANAQQVNFASDGAQQVNVAKASQLA
jgi:hypothetical protein